MVNDQQPVNLKLETVRTKVDREQQGICPESYTYTVGKISVQPLLVWKHLRSPAQDISLVGESRAYSVGFPDPARIDTSGFSFCQPIYYQSQLALQQRNHRQMRI